MDIELKKLYLALLFTENFGYRYFYTAVREYHSIKELFSAPIKELESILAPRQIKAINTANPDFLEKRAEKELERIEQEGYKLVFIEEDEYPNKLKSIDFPPPLLYLSGNTNLLKVKEKVAIIGSRRATKEGKEIAKRISRELSEDGIVVVSGLARGIDSSAHRGALKNSLTIAVLGSGIDIIYPKENYSLYNLIREDGLIISEFPLSTQPFRYNFPRRNRIISGLCDGVFVVEAGEKSGALITVNYALEQAREVMAYPGRISREQSFGVNRILREGAHFAEAKIDIYRILYPDRYFKIMEKNIEAKKEEVFFNQIELNILNLLSDKQRSIEYIINNIGADPGYVSTILMQLELRGFILQKPGKIFERTAY